jgi:hypothetical protein
MLLELDYSTFVLLPGTRNPSVGMMMQTTPGGATVVLDEHLVLESRQEPSSPSFSSQPSTPPFGARPPSSPKYTAEEAPPCRNGANCTIPMCTYSHPSSHFSNRSRLSFSSAPFMPSFSPTSSPVKHRYEPNKYTYDIPPSRTSSSESKHYEAFAAPLGLSSRTPSVSSSSRSSTSSNSPERSPDLPTRSIGGPNRRMVPSRKVHYDATFGTQTSTEGYAEFSRQAPIVLYANAN